jgi:phosphoenolpyruvate carboxylase
LRRQDITFEDKDQALRDDVRMLGAMIGELLVEQGGHELFDFVENARLRSIRRREDNEKPGEELAALVANLDAKFALSVIRAFSTYFQMVNIAGGASICWRSGTTSRAASRTPSSSSRLRASRRPTCRRCSTRC